LPDTLPYNEKELLTRIADGDEKAFEQMFSAYWKQLFSYAFNVLKEKEAAEDVVQDIFSWIWQNHKAFKITTSLRGYLFSATHYRILREIRTNRKIILDISRIEEKLQQESSEALLTIRDMEEHINTAIQLLPPKCKHIYQLSRDQLYSHKEIAEKLSISTKTVEAQLTIALARIRKHLSYLKIFFYSF
jgi:RNA polymerase sigma-70 factor (family 1)